MMTRKNRGSNSAKALAGEKGGRKLDILNGKRHLLDDFEAPLSEALFRTFEEEWSSEADERGYRDL